MELSDYRQQIDGIDSQLLALFYQRMEVAAQIAGYKKAHNLPALDAGRERAKLQHDSGLTITGRKMLTGGTVDPQHDHRIAMAAATAACGCTAPVTVRDRTCIEKSYPRFWTDLSALKTVPAAENTELE